MIKIIKSKNKILFWHIPYQERATYFLGGAKMDLHDKKQPYDEHDDLEEELLEEETDDIPDNEEYQEDYEETVEESAVKDDGMSQQKKSKNLGVYLAMALCLVALGVGAWATYDTVVKFSDVTQDTASSSAPQSSTAEVNQTVSGVPKDNAMDENLSVAESEVVSEGAVSSEEPVSSEVVSEQPVESQAPEYYNYPIAGQEILNGFSNGDPVYNMTMDDWRTHDGLDIGAEKGQNVMSIGAGTVVDSYEDIMWGNVLIIQHGDIEVRYCGLTDKSLLAAGDIVEDGQILGTVGTIPIEEESGYHLHIQMKKDDVWIDPTRVLKETA